MLSTLNPELRAEPQLQSKTTHPLWDRLLPDDPGDTAMFHGSSLSFLTAFYLKLLLLAHPDPFYLETLITKAVTNSTLLKCKRPNFCFAQHWEIKIICHHDFLVNWMFSPQVRDCSRCGNTLSVPHYITELTWNIKFPLKCLVLVPSRPTYVVSGPKQQITITKRYFVKSHLEEEGKCKFSS